MPTAPASDDGDPTERGAPLLFDRLRALRCLAAVAQHGSTVAAAVAIHMSQPAVTRAILDLEHALELRLFDRAARGMVPTAAGARAAQRARALFEHLSRGAQDAVMLSPQGRRRGGAGPERLALAAPPGTLRALVALGAAGSESGTARALGVTQPAVHRALRMLEHLCGAALFQSSPRGTRLTESGEALLRRVKLAFAEARALEGDIAAWRGELRGRILVGVLPLSVGLVLPQAVDAVLRRHPEIEIAIVDGTYESLMRQLRSADVDLIVGALRGTAGDEVQQEALFEDDLAVVARADHPCLKQPRLALRDLLQWDWVVPLAGTPAAAALAHVFAAQGLEAPSGALRASSPAMTRALQLQTGRLALGSRGQALDDHRRDRLRVVPVPLTGTTRQIGLALRAQGEPAPDLRVLLDELRNAARQLVMRSRLNPVDVSLHAISGTPGNL